MQSMYDRLITDTADERDALLRIPIVASLLGHGEVLSGDLVRWIYTRFLVQSYFHVREAPSVYAMAGARILPRDEPVRAWLLRHAVEEYGHDMWIRNDLSALGVDAHSRLAAAPAAPTQALVGWMHYVAGSANPLGILSDSFVIEGLSQRFATELAGNIQLACGLSDSELTYLARHGAADQAHMDDLRALIDANIVREEDYCDLVQCAKVTFYLYGSMLSFVASPG